MKETVRVILNGDRTGFRTEWESRAYWPFGDYGVAVLPSPSPELSLLREVVHRYPEMKCTEFMERTYSKKELRAFDAFVLWVNGSAEVEEEGGLEFGDRCPSCNFPGYRRRVGTLRLSRKPTKDLSMTNGWELVVSGRVSAKFEEVGLIGYSLSSTLIRGAPSDFKALNIEADLDEFLPTELRYDGAKCSVCGRYKKYYPMHPSKELWLPQELIPRADISSLNARLERTFNPLTLISKKAYMALLDLKATGWWVQPIHTIQS